MNIEKAKKEFDLFVKQYDLEFPKMQRKYKHSYRVMENSKNIAISMNLSNTEIEIATLIGLIHDIGHFEEIKVRDILKENSKMDHGDFGVKILLEDAYIRKFIEVDKYDNVILKAIKNHNKFKIEDGLSEKELLFAKIIRDADKLDIFYEGAEIFWTKREVLEEINNSKISDKVLAEFRENIVIDRNDTVTKLDRILSIISFIFDINFKYNFKVLKEQSYINRILDKFSFKDEVTSSQIEDVRKIVNDYIEKQL